MKIKVYWDVTLQHGTLGQWSLSDGYVPYVPHHKVKCASGLNYNKNFLKTNFTFPQMVFKYMEL